ncbi:MAG: response regulator transcription factor [Sporolactobacillus sp.]|jgi:DNA-binding NarL/FixJ family response regulator|nr:response regulator transcription factor [Sporolactobacillus sp.]
MDVVIVDDDRLAVSSLKTILEADPDVHVVGSGYSGTEAVALYRRLRPSVLLIDIRMEGMTGLEAAKALLGEDPDARILFLTTFSDDEYIIEALRIGAKGYILKQNYESIVPAIKAVSSGQSVFGDAVVNKIPPLMKRSARADFTRFGLSRRETEMIHCVAKGLSNREIAGKLFLSEGTVRNYISTILEKLNLRDRTQLAVFYYRQQS